VHHIYGQLKADTESQKSNKENEPSTSGDLEAGLRACDLQQLFVKHSSGDAVFFSDLGVCDVFVLS